MSSAIAAPAPARHPDSNRLVLRNVGWEGYRRISEALTNRPIRITYDRGTLEIMTKSSEHETWKSFFGRLVVVLSEETDQPIRSCGEMTCDREDLLRGIEPDDCFYLSNEPRVRGRNPIDLEHDPPPDLAVEIDISKDSVGRLPIYAALKVPEVWRFDGKSVHFYQLNDAGQYDEVERSRFFPFLSPADVLRFVEQWPTSEENSLVRAFREWVRQQVTGLGPNP